MSDIEKPIPVQITLNKKSRTLVVEFSSGEQFVFTSAYLRLHSLSADMRHGAFKNVEKDYSTVNILAIEPVGNYAIKPIFSDGHSTGIFSWETLYSLGRDLNKVGT